MAIEYKTEGRVVIEPLSRHNVDPLALVWVTNAKSVRMTQRSGTIDLDQRQLRELKGLIDTIWDDIGPEHHPRPATK